jgi:hypothetical protein
MTEVSPNWKSAKKPKTPTKTQQLRKADALFSKVIRSKGGCANCPTVENLQCAHGFSRRYRSVRWDERNAFALCRGCHVYFTHRPLEWDEWLRRVWGDDLYAVLRTLALTAPNPDLGETVVRLTARWEQIERRVA